jgi:hypothetical protein
MNSRTRLVVAAATLAWICTPRPGSAEIVYLTSGRTLSIKEHRVDGESIVLTLRSGGQVTCDRTLIDRILPDEVPHVDPPSAQAVPYAAPRELQPTTVLERTPYAEIIARASQAHGVNPLLVHALIQVESNYQPRAKSHKGAMGLMQLMPSTAREYKVRNPYDPKSNIEAGIKHLKSLIDRFGLELALAAYNAGPAAVQKFKGIPPYRETRNYVARILSLAGMR